MGDGENKVPLPVVALAANSDVVCIPHVARREFPDF